MGRLGMSTRLNAATLRVSSLPPRLRYGWLAWMGVFGCLFLVSYILTTTDSGHFYLWWALIFTSVLLLIAGAVFKEIYYDGTDRFVRSRTKRLDEHYEDLCERYYEE